MSEPEACLHSLLQDPRIWRGRSAGSLRGQRTGFAALDKLLPGRGWPSAALIELITRQPGIGELSLLLPSLRGQAQSWIAPPYLPYAPALSAQGVALPQLLLVRPKTATEALWAMEQILRAGTDSYVLGWQETLSMAALRRLQLAAETGGCRAFLFRPRNALQQASPAALRLYLEPAESGLYIRILKSRGGRPASLILPLSDQHALALPASASVAAGSPAVRAA